MNGKESERRLFHNQIEAAIRRAVKIGKRPTEIRVILEDGCCFVVEIDEWMLDALKSTNRRRNCQAGLDGDG